MSDQHGIGFVVTQVIVVGGSGIEIESNEIALRVERSANFECEGGSLSIPGGFLFAHPLHSDRTADFLGQKRRFKACVIGGRAAVRLRTIHPDHTYAIARHLQELGDSVAQDVGFHVI